MNARFLPHHPLRVLAHVIARLPEPVVLIMALIGLIAGGFLLVRPTTSLDVLVSVIGIGLIAAGGMELALPGTRREGSRGVLSIGWVISGVAMLFLPGLTVRALAVFVGLLLIARGVVGLISPWRSTTGAPRPIDARIASGLLGVGGIVFGVLAIVWPDITLLIVGVLFGVALMTAGAVVLLRALRRRRARRAAGELGEGIDPIAQPVPPGGGWGRRSRWVRTIGAVLVVAIATTAAGLTITLHDATTVADEFYAPPRGVPDEVGQLIRAEPFARGVPDGAIGWRILYTTSLDDDEPTVASGLVVVPDRGRDHPVIAWNHGTTGFDRSCAPSLAEEPFESGALFTLDRIVDHGWALVATDYIGLGTQGPHPYLVGEASGRAALDAVRAARQLEDITLSEKTVLWGHSQGGGSALWAAAIAKEYAPDLPIEGIAAFAPASDLIGLVGNLPKVTGGSVFASFVLASFTEIYPDITHSGYVRPGAEVTVRELSKRCLSGPSMMVMLLNVVALADDPSLLTKDATAGALGARLQQNIPPSNIDVPLLLGQGEDDTLIELEVQARFASRLCRAGVDVDFRRYPGLDHVPLVEDGSPAMRDLFAWTSDLLAGEDVHVDCR